MNTKTIGETISSLRKQNNMTQSELAKKMNVTDKAVSKWERNLSYPDITSISKLAKILGVDSSYLIDLCSEKNVKEDKVRNNDLINNACIAVSLAMGIAVIVLNIFNQVEIKNAITLLSIGLVSISFYMLNNR